MPVIVLEMTFGNDLEERIAGVEIRRSLMLTFLLREGGFFA